MLSFTVAVSGVNAARALFWTIPPRFLTGLAAAGGLAFINSIGTSGGFVGPYIMGWLTERHGDRSAAGQTGAGGFPAWARHSLAWCAEIVPTQKTAARLEGSLNTRLAARTHRTPGTRGTERALAPSVAEWVSTVTFDDLPQDVVEATKLRMLDVIGLALAGAETPFGRSTRDAAIGDVAAGPESRVGHR